MSKIYVGIDQSILVNSGQSVVWSGNTWNVTEFVDLVSNQTIYGNKTFPGDIVIKNLWVTGTTTTINTQNLSVANNYITINSGETGPGVTLGESGIIVDRGSLLDYIFVFDEYNDTFRIGESGNTQAVATRQDSPIDTGVAYWNDSATRFDTNSSFTWFGGILKTSILSASTISASTMYANVDWSYILNTPNFNIPLSAYTLLSIFNSHTASTNPHGTSFTGLTSTAHTHLASDIIGDIGSLSAYTLLTTFNTHTGSTGATNPHQTSFYNLTSTAHTHLASDIIGGDIGSLSAYTLLTTFNSHTADTSNPHRTSFSGLTATAHTHRISDVTGLTETLSVFEAHRINTSNPHLTTFNQLSFTSHTHLMIDVSGLTETLSSYTLLTTFKTHTGATNPHQTSFYDLTSSAHTHLISDITGLSTSLNAFSAYTLLTTFNAFTAQTSTNFLSANTFLNYVVKSGDTMTGNLRLPGLTATTISATTFYGNLNWSYITNTAHTHDDRYFTTGQTKANFLSANTFLNYVVKSGDTMTGNLRLPGLTATTISATTFYGNLNWTYLTNTSHTHDDRYYTIAQAGAYFLSANTFLNYVVKSGDTMTGTLRLPSLTATTVCGTTFFGNLNWSYITSKPTTLSGYGIVDVYNTAQTNANFLSANTFLNYVVKSGDTMTGILTVPRLVSTGDSSINGLTVGRGGGNISSNVAIGIGALNTNITGTSNVAIGQYAMLSNLSGRSNTVIGNSALRTNVSGVSNTVVGTAGAHDSQGHYNTLIGYWVMRYGTGDSNVGVGTNVLMGVSSGGTGINYNTAVGRDAMFSISTSNINNTSLGYASLYNVSGSSNIAIGAYSGKYATSSNELYIDNQDRTNNTNEKTKSIIYGVMSSSPATQTLRFNANVNINGNYTLPTISGISGQVLTISGDSTTYWSNQSVNLNSYYTSSQTNINFLSANTFLNYVVKSGDTMTGKLILSSSTDYPLRVPGSTLIGTPGIGKVLASFDTTGDVIWQDLGTAINLYWKEGFTGVNSLTVANGESDAFGTSSLSLGFGSYAIGDMSISTGLYTQTEGFGSTTFGSSDFGYHPVYNPDPDLVTIASGFTSFVAGYNVQSFADYSTSFGIQTRTYGVYSFAAGGGNRSYGEGSTSFGANNRAYGNYSFAGGFTSAAGHYNTNLSATTQLSGISSFVYSYQGTVRGNYSSVLVGYQNTLYGHYSAIIGGSGITGYADYTVYVPYLNLVYAPITGSSATQILVRKSDGSIETIDKNSLLTSVTWASITSKPTTLSGYGITDVYTSAQTNANFLSANTFLNYVVKSGDTMTGTLRLPLLSAATIHTSNLTATTIKINNYTLPTTSGTSGYVLTSLGTTTTWSNINSNFLSANTFLSYVVKSGDTMTGTLRLPLLSAATIHTSNLTATTIKINNYTLPTTSGTSGYVLMSSGSTTTYWANINNNFLSANTFLSYVVKSGDTMTGNLRLPGLTATTISATTFYGNLNWSYIVGEPTTLSGYGITDVYTTAQTELRYVSITGDTMTGNLRLPGLTATTISATTFYGNLNWSYITNTSHTHNDLYYTKTEQNANFASASTFRSHTADTTIHFTKSSIHLHDLGDVNTGNTSITVGYVLTWSGSSWTPSSSTFNTTNYYTKSETNSNFLSGNTFLNYVVKSGDTMTGYLSFTKLTGLSERTAHITTGGTLIEGDMIAELYVTDTGIISILENSVFWTNNNYTGSYPTGLDGPMLEGQRYLTTSYTYEAFSGTVYRHASYGGVGNIVGGVGTLNYIPKWNSTNTLVDTTLYVSANTFIGVNNITPKSNFDLNGSIGRNVTTITTTTTLDSTHNIILCNSESALSVNLPDASTINNRIYTIKNINTGIVTIDGNASQTIDGATSYYLSSKYQTISIVATGSTWYII